MGLVSIYRCLLVLLRIGTDGYCLTGSDIDTLVLGPKHVVIEDFFSDFPPVLERMAPPRAIEKITPVPDAYVPIIKLELSGISIDLIFARLIVHSIPMNLDLKNNDYLRGLDEREVRSLNGTRVTDEILQLVPEEKTFRYALRAIKLWAQRKRCRSDSLGFWLMVCCRPCNLFKHCRFPWRCCMGNVGRKSLSVIPPCDRLCHCG